MVATNEETYGVAGAAFYDGYFPIDEWAWTTAAFLAAVARDTGANEPIALELGIGTGTIVETARLDPVAQTIDFEVAVFSPTTGVALHPVKSRYVWPHELDLMAELGGLVPVARFGNFTDEPFHADSTINVVVYSRRPTADR